MNDYFRYISISHWGMFRVTPKHEQEVLAAIKKFEKIKFPEMKPIVELKA